MGINTLIRVVYARKKQILSYTICHHTVRALFNERELKNATSSWGLVGHNTKVNRSKA